MHFFDALFNAKNVAVIGATGKKGKVGNTIFNNLLKSGANAIPVNINTKWIGFHRTYDKITDYKGDVDLAVICIPSQFVVSVLEDCGIKGVKAVIVISAGFGETGNYELDAKVAEMCSKYNIELLGPNCLGTINCRNKLNASFFRGVPKYDSIAFVSQSGALGTAVLDAAIMKGSGFSKFVSVGNMLNTDFGEIIEYLNQDEDTSVICLYVESLKKGKEFIRAVKHSRKPIIALKSGRTESGAKAAASHTGSLSGSGKVYSGIFKQFHVFPADTISEMLTLAHMLKGFKKPNSNRVCIVTNAGGPGVLASDACDNFSLKVAELPDALKEVLNSVLPKSWSRNNPIDVIGDAQADRYSEALKQLAGKDFYDILLCILTPQDMTQPLETAKVLANFAKVHPEKRVFASFMGGESVKDAVALLEKEGITNFEEPYDFARLVSKMV